MYGGQTGADGHGNGTRFFHVNALGSVGMATKETGAYEYETLHYPWGQTWVNGWAWDARFASLPIYDYDLNLDVTLFRLYAPIQGRWISPDPVGGDITNPQSLNRYAYVLNNPTTLIDPLGLQGGDWVPHFQDVVTRSGGSCYVDQINTPCIVASGLLSMGAASVCTTAIQCAGYNPVTFSGTLYGNYVHMTFANWDAYSAWRTDLASDPKNQIYDAFWHLLENQGGNPNEVYEVQVYWWGLIPNVSGLGLLNTARAARGAVSDPYKGTHPGGSFISLWPPVDTSHCASTIRGAECHNDAFSPIWLLPLHGLFDYLPSKFINPQDNPNTQVPRGLTTWKCSIIGGCSQ